MDWNFRNDQPIYSQLTQRLTEAIVSGIYAPGEKLPSVRELAVEASTPTRSSARYPSSNATVWCFPSARRDGSSRKMKT